MIDDDDDDEDEDDDEVDDDYKDEDDDNDGDDDGDVGDDDDDDDDGGGYLFKQLTILYSIFAQILPLVILGAIWPNSYRERRLAAKNIVGN